MDDIVNKVRAIISDQLMVDDAEKISTVGEAIAYMSKLLSDKKD